jgi:S1-C subfamily serine protease
MMNARWMGVFLLAGSVWGMAPQDEPMVKVVEKVRPAVVNINTEKMVEQQVVDPFDTFINQFYGGGMARGNRILQTPVKNLGSGLIISPDGYIVTNQHVAGRANKLKIRVKLSNGKEYDAELLRDDDLQDLALIKVKAKEPLPFLSLEKLSPNLLGQTVLVLGNPVG